ncbi:cytochrome c oxidase subunit 3 [soil metagenome]|jgi:cytochrome c oxidase subunit 3
MTQSLPKLTAALDVSHLPNAAMGPASLVWWGTLGFMLIEGTGFVLGGGALLYLAAQAPQWPPRGDALPDLAFGTAFTVLILLSAIPNLWLERRARQCDLAACRWGLVVMSLIGVALLVLRGYEMAHLNVRWDADAYGSLVWLMIFLHLTHVITDLADTLVIGAWLFTHEPGHPQYADISDNAGYWSFVILAWPPIYVLVYWLPRWS